MADRRLELGLLPSDNVAAIAILNQHIAALNSVINELLLMQSPVSAGAPLRPRIGMLRYADGIAWNPGSGEGHYEYRSDAAWHKL